MKTIIFRPTNNCNLNCTYCYDKNNHFKSEENIIEASTQKFISEKENILKSVNILFASEKNPKIIFHGGEPLLVRTEELSDFCSKLSNRNIKFSIQTNGTLITKKTIDMFKKYHFSVGISLDGCDKEQNYQRIYPSGANSFDKVLSNLFKLKNENVKFGLIMSIAKQHVGAEQRLYDFIAKNDFNCNIRPVFGNKENENIMSQEEYAMFFNRLFNIWFNDEKETVKNHQILELYQALRFSIDPNYSSNLCNNSPDCFHNFISLDVDSNLYACNRLYGKSEFYYGNLKEDSLTEIQKKIDYLVNLRKQAVEIDCNECEEFSSCNGGCPAESYDVYGNIYHKAPICKTKELVKRHVEGVINGNN